MFRQVKMFGLPFILFFGSSMTIFFSIFSHQLNAKKILPFFFDLMQNFMSIFGELL